MAVHSSIKSLLRESLPQSIRVAECCVSRQFGYPAAILLFCAIDSIGSFYRKNKNFTIMIDGKARYIAKDGVQHFFILNSDFFELNLSRERIEQIYNNFRSLLVHNASLPPGCFIISSPDKDPFPIDKTNHAVNVDSLLELTKKAVEKFIKQIDDIVPTSDQHKYIMFRKLK